MQTRQRPGSTRSIAIFVALAFLAVAIICAPALLGADADYLVVLTPFAQWIPALAVLPALRWAGRRDRLRTAWRLSPFGGATTWTVLGLVTLAVVTVAAVQVLLGVSTGLVSWTPAPELAATALWVLPVALLALLSATGEEVGWRGYLWTELRDRRGFWVTALAVGMIWSAWHLPLLAAYGMQGDLPWRNVAATTIDLVAASLVLGAAREISGSVWPAAWGHALLNSALVFASTSFVTPDRALADADFWGYRAVGWAAWVLAAFALVAVHRHRATRTTSAGSPASPETVRNGEPPSRAGAPS